MNFGKVFLIAATLTLVCAQTSVSAQPSNGETDRSEADLRELATDMQLLSGLTERRAAIAKSTKDGRDGALTFLDQRIAQIASRLADVRSRLGK